ncbi:acidic phospholipase A2 HTe-like [Styela clava]
MKYITWTVLLYVILSFSAEIGEGFTQWLSDISSSITSAHRRSKRSLFEFEDVITCLQPWTDVLKTYADYGCYCGYRGSGQPLDDTDKCCFYHDKCYGKAEKYAASFSEKAYGAYFSRYQFQCVNNSKIICKKEENTEYSNAFCECDRLASECFLRARRSYTKALYNIQTSKYCTANPDLRDLQIQKHTLDKLYSCQMKLHDNKCCSDVGYNSEYEICCHGKVRKRLPDQECSEHEDL